MQYLDDEFEKSLPPMGHPLRKLGVRLTELLDEDQWAECERLLLEGWEHDAADRATGARELFTAAQLAPGEGIEDAVGRLADLIAALEEARSAINNMKVEAETAGQGDEQMMLEACETISNEGLQADMAIRAALASAPRPVPSAAGPREAPEGWRNQFAEAVYADLEAADNQDVPLEEYPTRILKVLDSIVGPRHPTVIHWRNDAIQACIAIAYKYCRDPESFQYLKQDLQALIFAATKTGE